MDLVTQLRNNEKRAVFALVGTVTPNEIVSTTEQAHILEVPEGATISRIFAVVKEAFVAGSTADIGVIGGSLLFDDLDLATVGVTDLGTGTSPLVSEPGRPIGITGSTEAISSATGLLQVVIQYVEATVTTGNYV